MNSRKVGILIFLITILPISAIIILTLSDWNPRGSDNEETRKEEANPNAEKASKLWEQSILSNHHSTHNLAGRNTVSKIPDWDLQVVDENLTVLRNITGIEFKFLFKQGDNYPVGVIDENFMNQYYLGDTVEILDQYMFLPK